MGRLAALLVIVSLASGGCFVMEELDQGAELIERHGSADSSSVSSAPPEPTLAEQATEIATQAREWWRGVRAPEPDTNPIVECHLDEGRAFATESDCLSRGGWVRPGSEAR